MQHFVIDNHGTEQTKDILLWYTLNQSTVFRKKPPFRWSGNDSDDAARDHADDEIDAVNYNNDKDKDDDADDNNSNDDDEGDDDNSDCKLPLECPRRRPQVLTSPRPAGGSHFSFVAALLPSSSWSSPSSLQSSSRFEANWVPLLCCCSIAVIIIVIIIIIIISITIIITVLGKLGPTSLLLHYCRHHHRHHHHYLCQNNLRHPIII